MRRFFLGAVVLGVLIGGVVSGVRAFTGGGSAAGSGAAAPAEVGSARATVEAFAKAWTTEDYQALYLLLDPESQRATTLEQFTAVYVAFVNEMTSSGLSAAPGAVQGTQATLRVKLPTAYFGQFEYTTILNLSRSPTAWLVHWDASAIHPDMKIGRAHV